MKNTLPLARFENIVVQEIKDEVLICDTKSNQVFCLNQTAGEVWKLCDGKTETNEIAKILSKKLKMDVSEDLILFSLIELSEKNLLTKKITAKENFQRFSRREVVRRIGLSSMIALPIITSVIMPKAIHAQSVECQDNFDCGFPLYCDLTTNTCQPRPGNCTTTPFQPNSCPPNLQCCGEGFQCSYGC